MKEKILALRANGKTYQQIVNELNCSKSLVCYYCGNNQNHKSRIRQDNRRNKAHPFERKVLDFRYKKYNFKNRYINNLTKWRKLMTTKITDFCSAKNNIEKVFTVEDVINKYTEQPQCYLTGDNIDIYQPRTYHFDHIIPTSAGGTNTIDNLGICTKDANMAKSGMDLKAFQQLCLKVVKNFDLK